MQWREEKPKKPYVPHAIDKTFCKRVYEQVAQVPVGHVCTYGKIAELAGYPNAAREVGRAMSLVQPEQDLNPHRIVNAKGTLAPYDVFGGQTIQRKLLEDEGVTFKAHVASARRRRAAKYNRWQQRAVAAFVIKKRRLSAKSLRCIKTKSQPSHP